MEVTAINTATYTERALTIGILVPSAEAAKNPSKQAYLTEAERHEFDYLPTFKTEIEQKISKNGDKATLVAFNDILESFKKTTENKAAYEIIQRLHKEAREEPNTEVFNLKRYKALFVKNEETKLRALKPNISDQESATRANFHWQQYLEGAKEFEGESITGEEKSPIANKSSFKRYDHNVIKQYEAALSKISDFIKNHPEYKNLAGMACPGNFNNVDKYGLNESCNRAVVGEALDLAHNGELPFFGVCGSEQSFLYALGLETVGNIKQHNFHTPELKLATSLTLGGTVLDSVSRANPDMSEDCMKDIVSAIVKQLEITQFTDTDFATIINNTRSEISNIYAEIHAQANLPSDFLEALAQRLDISAIQALVESTCQHFNPSPLSLTNLDMKELKTLVNHALLYTNTMHTMAIKVSAENLSLLKQHDIVISAVSVAVNKDKPDLDIHTYLNALSREAEQLAANRQRFGDRKQLTTIEDILYAHETLKAGDNWKNHTIELIVKAAERQIKSNFQKNSSPVMITQYHPEYPSGGNSNSPLITGAIKSMNKHFLVTKPFKELLTIYAHAEEMRKTSPQYQLGSSTQNTMRDLMAHFENSGASLNAGQQTIVNEIQAKYGETQTQAA